MTSTHRLPPPVVLDGTSLAARRVPLIAHRAAAVRELRGHAPRMLLVAFGDERGRVPHVERKLRAFAAAGVDAVPLILPAGTGTDEAGASMTAASAGGSCDGVFLQFPFPDDIDGDALSARIPVELDVDIMTPERTDRFLAGDGELPPVTVSAGLLLLDAYGIDIAGLDGIVIAEQSPFAAMFHAAFERRGARMRPLVAPDAPDLAERVREADLVIAGAASPSLIAASDLSAGAVAIDVGYFNPGGRGDIDLSDGVAHLAAIAPVPGGIGPMTVSALIERVVLFAEGA